MVIGIDLIAPFGAIDATMRITTGRAKGHRIKVPKGTDIRPTKDMVRQAIFSIISHGIRNAKVADLFAGSGALGLEALSRGAKSCTFVDLNPTCAKIILENLNHTNLSPRGRVYTRRVEEFIRETPDFKYDIIFADPPYKYPHLRNLMLKMARILRKRGVLVLEHSKSVEFKEDIDNLKVLDRRKYGLTGVTFLQKES